MFIPPGGESVKSRSVPVAGGFLYRAAKVAPRCQVEGAGITLRTQQDPQGIAIPGPSSRETIEVSNSIQMCGLVSATQIS
jgi:hypothetical protein